MTCELTQRVGAWLDGEIPAAERASFETHVAGCPACAREAAQLRALSGLIAGGAARELPAGVLARLQRREAAVVRDLGVARVAEWLTAAAATVLLACGGWLALGGSHGASAQAASIAPWEQAAVTLRADAGNEPQQIARWIVEDLSQESRP